VGADAVRTASSVRVEEATQVTPALIDGFARLLPQLSRSAPPVGAERLQAIVDSPACILLTAIGAGPTGDEVVGTLTLALFPLPTGIRAWVEDVVVDAQWQGLGVGAALIGAGLDRARACGARTVDLTSRPSREAANRLYRRLGFIERDTNVYRLTFDLKQIGGADV